ncbi:MAG: hypothetical protein ACNA7K_00085 [Acholeplasmataceae bacterium]
MKTKWLPLSIFTAAMTLFLYQTFQLEGIFNALILPFFILFIFAIYDQYRIEKESEIPPLRQKDLISLVFVLVGFVLSFGLYFYASMPQIAASALTGVIGYVFLREYEKEVYCGSFAGMISLVVVSPIFIILMVVILPVAFLMSRSIFNGLGGKLGTTAFVASIISVSLLPSYQVISTEVLEPMSIFIVMGTALGTVLLGHYVKVKFQLSRVIVSALLSLFGFLIFSLLPSLMIYLPVVFIASFIIMTDISRIKGLSFLVISPLVMSLLYMLTRPIYTCIGGKAGLTALLSVLITLALLNTFQMMLYRDK